MQSKEIRQLDSLSNPLDSGIDNFLVPIQDPNSPYLSPNVTLNQLNSYFLSKSQQYPPSSQVPSNPINRFNWPEIRPDGLIQDWIYNSNIGRWLSRQEYISPVNVVDLTDSTTIPFLIHALSTEYDPKSVLVSDSTFDIHIDAGGSDSDGTWNLQVTKDGSNAIDIFTTVNSGANSSSLRTGLVVYTLSQQLSIPQRTILNLSFVKNSNPPNLSVIGNLIYHQIYSHS